MWKKNVFPIFVFIPLKNQIKKKSLSTLREIRILVGSAKRENINNINLIRFILVFLFFLPPPSSFSFKIIILHTCITHRQSEVDMSWFTLITSPTHVTNFFSFFLLTRWITRLLFLRDLSVNHYCKHSWILTHFSGRNINPLSSSKRIHFFLVTLRRL